MLGSIFRPVPNVSHLIIVRCEDFFPGTGKRRLIMIYCFIVFSCSVRSYLRGLMHILAVATNVLNVNGTPWQGSDRARYRHLLRFAIGIVLQKLDSA